MTRPDGVGFIGLGNIGRPMAERLVSHPGGLWVHDVDADATAALEQLGAKRAPSAAELAEQCAVICVMVRDDDQVRAVVDGAGGILDGAAPGAVVVVHSTVRPETPADIERRCSARGVLALDAPVSGGAPGAKAGRLAIMCGGPLGAYEAALPVLERLGELVVHVGPAGAGTRAKLARNLLHFVAFAATGEANRLAQAAGIDLQLLGRIVRHTDAITGGPGAIMLRDTAAAVEPGSPWFPILDAVRLLGEKDLDAAVELAQRLDVDVPLARLARERLAGGLGLAQEEST